MATFSSRVFRTFKGNSSPPVVFLVSPTQRSGTNLLRNMLAKAKVVQVISGKHLSIEDWFLENSHHLENYIDELTQKWNNQLGVDLRSVDAAGPRIWQGFGQSLLNLVEPNGSPAVVLKTPSSRNISNHFKLFPGNKLLQLIRDGRDTCESYYKSGYAASYAEIFTLWASRADELLKFNASLDTAEKRKATLLVRYEDILIDMPSVLLEIAKFLGTSADMKKAGNLEDLPVYGSSELGSCNSGGEFSYQIQPRPPGFSPVGRWKSWSPQLRDQFKQIANEQLVALGYEKDESW